MAGEQSEVKSLTNIYYDCLERIFESLDLEDLLNVGRTCKQLKTAAAAKFADRYGTKTIFLVPFDTIGGSDSEIMEFDNYIDVGQKIRLPFLWCFGSKIKVINITHHDSEQIVPYINKYCTKSLTSLTFHCCRAFSNDNIRIPLGPGVIFDLLSLIVKVFYQFSKWFYITNDFIPEGVTFPHLKHLSIGITRNCETRNCSSEICEVRRVAKCLRANPQLQSLKMWSTLPISFNGVLNMLNRNQSITELVVWCIFWPIVA